jgi:uncharacterized membrane protein
MEKIELKHVKIYGGIGVIFTILGGLRRIGPLLRIAGLILILIALYELAQRLKEEKIFKQYLTGIIINIVGTGFAITLAVINGAWSIAKMILFGGYTSYYDIFSEISFALIFFVLLLYAITILSTYFYRESLKSITAKTTIKTFALAGDFIFYGAIGIIVILGIFAMFVGWILLAVAFFNLPDTIEIDTPTDQNPETTSS